MSNTNNFTLIISLKSLPFITNQLLYQLSYTGGKPQACQQLFRTLTLIIADFTR